MNINFTKEELVFLCNANIEFFAGAAKHFYDGVHGEIPKSKALTISEYNDIHNIFNSIDDKLTNAINNAINNEEKEN